MGNQRWLRLSFPLHLRARRRSRRHNGFGHRSARSLLDWPQVRPNGPRGPQCSRSDLGGDQHLIVQVSPYERKEVGVTLSINLWSHVQKAPGV